jgi:hypothetical protein
MSIADIERIHTQFLYWIFSNNFHGLNDKNKLELLNTFFGLDENKLPKSDKIYTEKKNIDLVIELENLVIVVENKFKSSLRINQQADYEEKIKREYSSNKLIKYYLLTLINEQGIGGWEKVNYSLLLSCLSSLKKENHTHSHILSEYILYLENLDSVLKEFNNSPSKFSIVFKNGNTKKDIKQSMILNNREEYFISRNQLETIFQKQFLYSILKDIIIPDCITKPVIISETRGIALIDFKYNKKCNLNKDDKIINFETGIQFQDGVIKFTYSIERELYQQSTRDWFGDYNKLEKVMKEMKGEFNFQNFNPPKSKAYISISKKCSNENWWENKNALITELNSELQKLDQLSNYLLKRINLISNLQYLTACPFMFVS